MKTREIIRSIINDCDVSRKMAKSSPTLNRSHSAIVSAKLKVSKAGKVKSNQIILARIHKISICILNYGSK